MANKKHTSTKKKHVSQSTSTPPPESTLQPEIEQPVKKHTPQHAKLPQNVKTSVVIKMLVAVVAINAVVFSLLIYMLVNGSAAAAEKDVLAVDNLNNSTVSSNTNDAENLGLEEMVTLEESNLAVKAEEMSLKELGDLIESGKIFENISVNGVDVGGMTEAEAASTLTAKIGKPLADSQIVFVKEKDSQTKSATELGANFDAAAAAKLAYQYGRNGGADANYEKIRALKTTPHDISVDIKIDNEALDKALSAISSKYEVAFAEPKLYRKDGQFFVLPEKAGISVDRVKLAADTKPLLAKGGEVKIETVEVNPKYSSSEFGKAVELIGSYSTDFEAGETNRNNNIKVAAGKINNITVMPGETFSTNNAFGPSTLANGYKEAGSFLLGEIVQSIGGGMCQVSSTLYMALLNAELEIVQRQNHSLAVAYVPGGCDATLSEGSIDLVFKNNTEYPVTLESIVTKNSVKINVYGRETRNSSRTIEFDSVRTAVITPPAPQEVYDSTMLVGQRVTERAEKNGARYELYKVVKVGGVQTERILINRSTYQATQGKIRLGTGSDSTPSPSEEATPEPEETVPPIVIPTDEPQDIIVPTIAPFETPTPEEAPSIDSTVIIE